MLLFEKSENPHYYLLYRKRGHTTHVRFRDYIGEVIAEKNRPPFRRGAGVGMRNVDWWHDRLKKFEEVC